MVSVFGIAVAAVLTVQAPQALPAEPLGSASDSPGASERRPRSRQAGNPGLSVTGHLAFRWTRMYEDDARLVGGGLGIRVNDRTRVELVVFGTAEPSRYSTVEFRLAYGGMQIERELLRRGRFATGAAGTLAIGIFSVEDGLAGTEESTGVWLAEPELFVAAWVSEHLRLTAGGSYRWVSGIEGDIQNRSDGDARGPCLTLRLTVN